MSLRVLSEILEEIKKNCINRDVETHVKTNCDVEKFLTVLKKLVIVQVRASRFPLLLKEKSSSSSPVKFSLELHKSPVFLVALELLFSVRAAGLLEKHPEMIVLFLKLLKSALTEHEQDFTHAAQEVSRERGAETVKDGLRYHPEYGLHKAQANLMKSICDVLISKEQLGGGKTSCDKDRRQLVDTCKSSLYKLQQQQQQQLHLRGLEDPFVDTEMQGFTQSFGIFPGRRHGLLRSG